MPVLFLDELLGNKEAAPGSDGKAMILTGIDHPLPARYHGVDQHIP